MRTLDTRAQFWPQLCSVLFTLLGRWRKIKGAKPNFEEAEQ